MNEEWNSCRGAMLMLGGGSMQINADTKICVFDLLGKSVDAIGAVPSYAIAQKAISFALDKRNQCDECY